MMAERVQTCFHVGRSGGYGKLFMKLFMVISKSNPKEHIFARFTKRESVLPRTWTRVLVIHVHTYKFHKAQDAVTVFLKHVKKRSSVLGLLLYMHTGRSAYRK
jgi:hypothetical protein